MALPSLLTKLYQNGGYGPKLKPEIIPFASSILSDSALDVASTQWIRKAIGFTPLYVDGANGSDSNDGTSQATAVKTIGQALSLVTDHLGQQPVIYIAAGIYTEDVLLSGQSVTFELQGDITLSGSLTAREGSELHVLGSHTLTVNSFIYISTQSLAYFYCDIIVNDSTPGDYSVAVSENSCMVTRGSVSIAGDNSIYACLFITNGGFFYSDEPVSIIANGVDIGIEIARGSIGRFWGGFSISGSGASRGVRVYGSSVLSSVGPCVISSGVVTYRAFHLSSNSVVRFEGGDSVFHGSSSRDDSIVLVENCSSFLLDGSAKLNLVAHFPGSGSLWCLAVRANSSFIVYGSTTLSFTFGTSAKAKYLVVAYNGTFFAYSGATINFGTGFVGSATVTSTNSGLIDIDPGATISGSITGKRYAVDYGSTIYVHGAGANRIPGSAAGTASTTNYGYYG